MKKRGFSLKINFKVLDIIVIMLVLLFLIITDDIKENVIVVCVLALYFVLKQKELKFSYLRDLPIDVLKIDKSFIDYIGKDKKSEYIIEKLIELSHYFNLDIVAEGVENNSQYEFLKEINCDTIQGYYFYKPLRI